MLGGKQSFIEIRLKRTIKNDQNQIWKHNFFNRIFIQKSMEKLASSSHLEFMEFCQEYADYTEKNSNFLAKRNLIFLKSTLTDPRYVCYLERGKGDNLQAFLIYRIDKKFPNEGRIMAIYASPQFFNEKKRLEKEKELFHFAFLQLQKQVQLIGVTTHGYSPKLLDFIQECGFTPHLRYAMEISREKVLNLPLRTLPEIYELISWDNKFSEEMIPIIKKYNEGSIDNKIFGFFHTLTAVRTFLKELQSNRWGIFTEKHSQVLILHHNAKRTFQGVCFFTVFENDRAYIPDIGVIPKIRGKGLGKTMLSESMRHLLENNPQILKVQLDVTLDNPAYLMYKSLGFTKLNEYSVMSWNHEDLDLEV